MGHDDDVQTNGPDVYRIAIHAIAQFETAAGYGRAEGASWIAADRAQLTETADAVVATESAIGWNDRCTCDAPERLYERIQLAYALTECFVRPDPWNALQRVNEVVDEFARAEDIVRLGVALQLQHSLELELFGPKAAHTIAESARPYIARSAACWWALAESALHAERVERETLGLLRNSARAHRSIVPMHLRAMASVVKALQDGWDHHTAPDLARLSDTLHKIDGRQVLELEGVVVKRLASGPPIMPWSLLMNGLQTKAAVSNV